MYEYARNIIINLFKSQSIARETAKILHDLSKTILNFSYHYRLS
ncbi:hypothetical protein HMPREF1139_0571 [Campylobacter sp. FOBRC14]|nr:hypothetical protein HMPREF1139_0571 [Campylobacter sp. FOBRC14]